MIKIKPNDRDSYDIFIRRGDSAYLDIKLNNIKMSPNHCHIIDKRPYQYKEGDKLELTIDGISPIQCDANKIMQIIPNDTLASEPGEYNYQIRLYSGVDVFTVSEGVFVIEEEAKWKQQ